MAYIEERTQEYLNELEQNDQKETSVSVTEIQEKMKGLKKNKIRYELLKANSRLVANLKKALM